MEMLGQSVILTVLGMGIVFIFLFIMIIVINRIGRLINGNDSYKPENSALAGEIPQGKDTEKKRQIAAAITAGIAEYRKSQKS